MNNSKLHFIMGLAMFSWAIAWTNAKIVNEYLSFYNLDHKIFKIQINSLKKMANLSTTKVANKPVIGPLELPLISAHSDKVKRTETRKPSHAKTGRIRLLFKTKSNTKTTKAVEAQPH